MMARCVGLLLCSLACASIEARARAQEAPEQPIEGLEVQPGGLTATQTAERALAASSSVREKRAQLDVARAKIAQTTIEFFPKVGLRASYTRLSPAETSFGSGALVGAANAGLLQTGPCPNGAGTCVLDAMGAPVGAAAFDIEFFEDNYALSANLAIPLSDYVLRLADAAASASASKQSAQYALDAERRKVHTDAQVLYYQWLRAQAQVFIARRAVERTRARVDDARAALGVGRLSNADLLRFEAQAAKADLALTQVDGLCTLTEAQLAILMQDRAAQAYRIGQSVPSIPTPPPAERELGKQLVARALANRLELKAIDATTRALDLGRDAVASGAWPRVAAVAEASYANPNPRYFPPVEQWKMTWSAGIVASFNIDDPFMSDARASELAANAETMRATRGKMEAAIAHEVVTALVQVSKSHAAIAALQTAQRAAEENYRVTSELFNVGRATPTDVIDAESELFGAKAQLTDARIEAVIAQLQLTQALGDGGGGRVAR